MTNKTTIAASLFLALSFAAGCVADTGDTGDSGPSVDSDSQALSLPPNAKPAFLYFTHKGLTKRQSAGIVGNLMQESGVNPGAIQPGGPGRGIAQWSVGGRWDTSFHDNVTWYANRGGTSRWSLGTQLAFTWYELATVGGYGLQPLRNTSTIDAATIVFMDDFERCGQCDATNRINYAREVYNAYAGLADEAPTVDNGLHEAAQPDQDLQADDPAVSGARAAD
jgi:hypothetical protein